MTTLYHNAVRRSEDAAAVLTDTGEHLSAQLQETRAKLKESGENGRAMQGELLALSCHDGKMKK